MDGKPTVGVVGRSRSGRPRAGLPWNPGRRQGVAVQDLAFVALVVFALWAGVVVGSAVFGVRLARRLGRRVRARAREAVDHARVRAASYGVGRGAEVASLRLDLREAIGATRRAVTLAGAAGQPVG
ncbi:MAG: hypothetical protein ACRDPT_00520, partial [Streptomycetales bacterium]